MGFIVDNSAILDCSSSNCLTIGAKSKAGFGNCDGEQVCLASSSSGCLSDGTTRDVRRGVRLGGTGNIGAEANAGRVGHASFGDL